MALTRRDILLRIGAVGGAGATFAAMQALGLALTAPADASDFELPAGTGNGTSVVVLGAGVAGLVACNTANRDGLRRASPR